MISNKVNKLVKTIEEIAKEKEKEEEIKENERFRKLAKILVDSGKREKGFGEGWTVEQIREFRRIHQRRK